MFHFQFRNYDFSHKLNNYTVVHDEYSKHRHNILEIIYFVKGKVEFNIENQILKPNSGDIILITPSKYHSIRIHSESDYERYVIKMPMEVIPDYLTEKINNNIPYYLSNKKYEFTFNQFDNYIDKFNDEEIVTLISSDIIKILIFLLNQPNTKSEHQNTMITKIIDYIDANIKSDISLNTFVKDLHFSKSYISNEFKKYMKIPLMKYIRNKKITEAHRLILAGEKKTAVAKQLGFDDYSTFYRTYTKFFHSEKK